MRTFFNILIFSFIIIQNVWAQPISPELVKLINTKTNKGEYAIIEVRLNNEDEFKTIEGSSSGLSRITVFIGNKQKPIVSKGFNGFSEFTFFLNELTRSGWEIIAVYPLKGQSLIVTHYLIKKVKK